MQGSAAHQQDGEGDCDSQYQSEADDDSAAESHGEYQYQDDNQDRFYQVDHERTDGLIHLVGLEEYLFRFHAYGYFPHDFCQPSVYGFSHIGHDGVFLQGQADGQCRFPVYKETVPLRFGVGAFYLCHIFQPDLFSLRSTDEQVADVGFIGYGTAHMELYPVVLVQVAAGIHCLSGTLQAHHDLGRDDAVACNLFFRQGDVDDFVPVAADEDAFHTFHSQQLPSDQFGIFVQFRIRISVASEGVENAVYIHHVVHYNRVVTSLGKFGAAVVYFPSQQVEMLLQVFFQDSHLKFHGKGSHSVLTLRLDFLDVGEGTEFFLHHLRYFQLHLVGIGTRIRNDDHGLFH